MMRMSDPTKVMLASGSSRDATLGVWRLNDLNNGFEGRLTQKNSHFWHPQIQNTPLQALAWHPAHHGLLATGGGDGD